MAEQLAKIRSITDDLVGIGLPYQVVSIIEQIILANAPVVPVPLKAAPQPSLASIAGTFRKVALQRSELIGDLLHDTAWHMLLALFADIEEGRKPSVSSLIHASGSPATTALRTLKSLEELGLIRRADDPRDARRVFILPQADLMERMSALIKKFCVSHP